METSVKPHGARYPWKDWFRKATEKPLTLLRGVDFSGQPHGMAQTIRQAAIRHRVRVEVTIDETKVTVRVLK